MKSNKKLYTILWVTIAILGVSLAFLYATIPKVDYASDANKDELIIGLLHMTNEPITEENMNLYRQLSFKELNDILDGINAAIDANAKSDIDGN
jgi:hypothetical protein